ncbi:hypothetical protein E3P99_01411 [Wallemia hederae]|uniref:Chalcone isomerase domain-containing protein n=1 Tax=Wallemia hederae TaxID=1540922 RepID=A0A4T0FV17_9BASI|nr:hypothetical protein E3P99_01411 [Wallemia hederae]
MRHTSQHHCNPTLISQATHLFHLYHHQCSDRSRSEEPSSRDACMPEAYRTHQRRAHPESARLAVWPSQAQRRCSCLDTTRVCNVGVHVLWKQVYNTHNNAQAPITLDANAPNKPILASVLENVEAHFSKDADTGVSFPNQLDNVYDSGVLKLLGLGVRTVSFLRVRVYSLGIYAEESAQRALSAVENVKQKLNTASSQSDELVGEKLMEKVISSPYTFAVRIVPVRNTDFGHLRDGFVRAVQARMKTAQLGAEESQQVNESLQAFKAYFPASKVPKGDELTLTKTRKGDLVLSYNGETLGKLDSNAQGVRFISTQLLLAYFADKNPISVKAKDSVVSRL